MSNSPEIKNQPVSPDVLKDVPKTGLDKTLNLPPERQAIQDEIQKIRNEAQKMIEASFKDSETIKNLHDQSPDLKKNTAYSGEIHSLAIQIVHKSVDQMILGYDDKLENLTLAIRKNQADQKHLEVGPGNETIPTREERLKQLKDLQTSLTNLKQQKEQLQLTIRDQLHELIGRVKLTLKLVARQDNTKKGTLSLGEVSWLTANHDRVALFVGHKASPDLIKIMAKLSIGEEPNEADFSVMIKFLGTSLNEPKTEAERLQVAIDSAAQWSAIDLIIQSLSPERRYQFGQYIVKNLRHYQEILKQKGYGDLLDRADNLQQKTNERDQLNQEIARQSADNLAKYPKKVELLTKEYEQLQAKIAEKEGVTEPQSKFNHSRDQLINVILQTAPDATAKQKVSDFKSSPDYQKALKEKTDADKNLTETKTLISQKQTAIDRLANKESINEDIVKLEQLSVADIQTEYGTNIATLSQQLKDLTVDLTLAVKDNPDGRDKQKNQRLDLQEKIRDQLKIQHKQKIDDIKAVIKELKNNEKEESKIADAKTSAYKKFDQDLTKLEVDAAAQSAEAFTPDFLRKHFPRELHVIEIKIDRHQDYKDLQNSLKDKYVGQPAMQSAIDSYIQDYQNLQAGKLNVELIEQLAKEQKKLTNKPFKPDAMHKSPAQRLDHVPSWYSTPANRQKLRANLQDLNSTLDLLSKTTDEQTKKNLEAKLAQTKLAILNLTNDDYYTAVQHYLAVEQEVSQFNGPTSSAELKEYAQDKDRYHQVQSELKKELAKYHQNVFIDNLEKEVEILKQGLDKIKDQNGKDSLDYLAKQRHLEVKKTELELAKKPGAVPITPPKNPTAGEWGSIMEFKDMKDELDKRDESIQVAALEQLAKNRGGTVAQQQKLAGLNSDIKTINPEGLKTNLDNLKAEPEYQQNEIQLWALDSLLKTGAIDSVQARSLQKEAADLKLSLPSVEIKDGKITVKDSLPIAKNIKEDIYAKVKDEVEAKAKEVEASLKKGEYLNPAIFAFEHMGAGLVGIWAVATALLNLFANWRDPQFLLTSKPFLASIGVGLGTAEYIGGGGKWGQGPISNLKNKNLSAGQEKIAMEETWYDKYYSQNPHVADYLLKNFDYIKDHVKEREKTLTQPAVQTTHIDLKNDLPAGYETALLNNQTKPEDTAQILSGMYNFLVKEQRLDKDPVGLKQLVENINDKKSGRPLKSAKSQEPKAK